MISVDLSLDGQQVILICWQVPLEQASCITSLKAPINYCILYRLSHYPTTNLFVFFKNFAGIGRSSCQVIFMGLLPLCFT